MIKKKKWIRRLLFCCILCILGAICLGVLQWYMIFKTKDYILTMEEASALEDVDCILVLGAGVWDGSPSPMLRDRLDIGVELYKNGASDRLLMSGDHGRDGYNEVGVMKAYAMDRGILSEAIFMDHAGFSTYESAYRASCVFCAKKVIIVTQKYHMYRALYDARMQGIDAYGVCAETIYSGQRGRDIREIMARTKDFFYVLFSVKPTYIGDPIPVNGNGDVTND